MSAYPGSNKAFSVEHHSIRKEQLLQTLPLNASVENRLHTVERLFADKWLKIPTPRHVEFRNVNQARIEPIREHPAEALRVERQPLARAESKPRDLVEDFVFREPACREFFKRTLHQLGAFRVSDQTFARPFWSVEIAEGRHERPAALLQRRSHACARPFRSHVVVELREGGQDAFHQLSS
ncbi:MAG: hypothetical protein A3F70_03130 [Acidobacteria bacterium RIFCSPLOWO2_12_FULL_67_14]|nr:MAG: hypothetical protein A3H29_18085 [Acidobacteria bacterium RIFCSPLOWO2_02_FULL_67_21]OFW37915.1 MAG: hypothetical protein A3F70_03130 [Acidobacteria bacterium RIFCSPLOWO2_12_FULL_67_14]